MRSPARVVCLASLWILVGLSANAASAAKPGGRATKPPARSELFARDASKVELSPALARAVAKRRTTALLKRTEKVLRQKDDKLSFGARTADRVAELSGTWRFIGLFNAGIGTWMALNKWFGMNFDPYPFIMLNFVVSWLTATQQQVLMMSQNRIEQKDRARGEATYKVDVHTSERVGELHDKMAGLEENVGQLRKDIAILVGRSSQAPRGRSNKRLERRP
jgi:uncharacterized membrane protein